MGLTAAGFEAIVTEDWSRHVLPSFDLLTAEIAAKRAQLAAIASEADVAETLERYALWCKAARTGNLGWVALVGTRRTMHVTSRGRPRSRAGGDCNRAPHSVASTRPHSTSCALVD